LNIFSRPIFWEFLEIKEIDMNVFLQETLPKTENKKAVQTIQNNRNEISQNKKPLHKQPSDVI
jgi:hypothetical protein